MHPYADLHYLLSQNTLDESDSSLLLCESSSSSENPSNPRINFAVSDAVKSCFIIKEKKNLQHFACVLKPVVCSCFG